MSKAEISTTQVFNLESELTGQEAFFSEAARGKTILHIVNLAKFNPGIIALMGDEGSGRSFLLRKLSARINQKPGLMGTINRVVKTTNDLYLTLAECFSLEIVEGESTDSLEERVVDFLQGSFVTHRPVVLAVDDIQQFSLSMLEALIKLVRRYKKITLLLLGDNNLSAMLKRLEVGNAVRHEIVLKPLSRGEMRQFINWRLPFAIDDHEFEDIVNTTQGNFGLLEREAQKKEAAHEKQQASKGNPLLHILRTNIRMIMVSGFVVVTAAFLYYLVPFDTVVGFISSQQQKIQVSRSRAADAEAVRKPKPSARSTADNDRLVQRQLELLTALPESPTETPPVAPLVAEVTTPVVNSEPETRPTAVEDLPQRVQPVIEKPVVEKQVIQTMSVAAPVAVSELPASKPVVAVVEVVPMNPVAPTVKNPDEDDAAVLLSMTPAHYSIQVLGAQSRKTVDKFMAAYKDGNAMYCFRTERNGKDWYTVMYGSYETRQAALEAVAQLPEDIRKSSPWPRRLSEIHALINARPVRQPADQVTVPPSTTYSAPLM